MAPIHAGITALQRLSDVFSLRREQLAASVDLTEHQWGVLEEIATEHFMPSMFARRRSSSPAAVSKTLRQLIDRQLISVAVGQDDGRRRAYKLTSKGRRVMDRLRAGRLDAVDRIWKDLDPKELERFSRFADDLAERMEQYAGHLSKDV